MSCSTELAGDRDPAGGTLLDWNVSTSWCNSQIFCSKSFRISSLERWSSTTEEVNRFKDSRISACLCEAKMLWKFSRWANDSWSSWECRINEEDWSVPERLLDVPLSKWRYCMFLSKTMERFLFVNYVWEIYRHYLRIFPNVLFISASSFSVFFLWDTLVSLVWRSIITIAKSSSQPKQLSFSTTITTGFQWFQTISR